jgi:hypothetical protein
MSLAPAILLGASATALGYLIFAEHNSPAVPLLIMVAGIIGASLTRSKA